MITERNTSIPDHQIEANVPTSRKLLLRQLSKHVIDVFPYRLSKWTTDIDFVSYKNLADTSGLAKSTTTGFSGEDLSYYTLPEREMEFMDCEGAISITNRSKQFDKIRNLIFVSDQIPPEISDLWAIRENELVKQDFLCIGFAVMFTEKALLQLIERSSYCPHFEIYTALRKAQIDQRLWLLEEMDDKWRQNARLIIDLELADAILRKRAREDDSIPLVKHSMPKHPVMSEIVVA